MEPYDHYKTVEYLIQVQRIYQECDNLPTINTIYIIVHNQQGEASNLWTVRLQTFKHLIFKPLSPKLEKFRETSIL